MNEPVASPDGQYVYYSEDVSPGGFFQYNKDPNRQIYAIKRYDFATGETQDVTGGPGGALRPQVSRDGKKTGVYKTGAGKKTVLYIHDLQTGEEKPVYDDLNKDQQEAWAIFGVYPNYSWTPDNAAIVIWSKGKIKRVDLASLKVTDIPFKVTNTLKIADALHFRNDAFKDEFVAHAVRNAVTSPDGKTLVFNAAGYIWKKELPNGTPSRVTSNTDLEFEPAFSSNGNEIAFVTWNDETLGSIQKLNLKVKGSKPQKITTVKGIYRTPSFSPDGSKIVFIKEEGNDHQGFSFNKNPGIYWIASTGGEMKMIRNEGEFPQFNKDGSRIFYTTGDGTKILKSIKTDGTDEKSLITSKFALRLMPSPDEKWVAFSQLHKVYVAALPQIGKTIDLDSKGTDLPLSQLARDAGF